MADLKETGILSELSSKLTSDKKYLDSLKEYYESICYLADNEFSLEFNNKDENHGALVMSLLFNKAKESIKIFCGNYAGNICDKNIYMKSLFEALDRGVSLKIVFENQPNDKSECYKKLFSSLTKNNNLVEMRILNSEYRQNLFTQFGEILHFTIVDSNKFRYETDPVNFKAFCNFDDKDNAEILNSNFDKLLVNSTLIPSQRSK